MPRGEDCAGHGGGGHRGEVGFGKAYGEAGVLHAYFDFDGEGHCLFPGKATDAGYSEAQGIAQAVIVDDYQQDDAEISNDSGLTGADKDGDDEGDGDGENSRLQSNILT